MREFNIRPVVNKRNGQINFSIPKKKFSDKAIEEISKARLVRFKVVGVKL